MIGTDIKMPVTPYTNVAESKKEQVEKMFNAIAFRYDLLNQLLSFGIHKRWRKKAIRLLNSKIPAWPVRRTPFGAARLNAQSLPSRSEELLSEQPGLICLDVATGTADFAIDACTLKPKKIIGIDISADMLSIGREKIKLKNLSHLIELVQADSEDLPFPDNHFDAATVGFGVRNFENLDKGLLEICRVLKKGGVFAVLEFSIPEKFPMKQLYNFYFKNICPLIGRIISKNPIAYTYLFKSASAFPYGENFKSILFKCGFSEINVVPQTFGIVTIYIAQK